MKRRFRLTGSTDFQRVRRFGKAVRHPLLVMVALPNDLQATRIGVVAGRAVGKAVQRNRAKRLVRHTVQPYLDTIPEGWDILLIARSSLPEATYQQVSDAIISLFRRAGLFVGSDELDNR